MKFRIQKNNLNLKKQIIKNEQQLDKNAGIRYYDSTTLTIRNTLTGENEDTLNK